MMSDFVNDIAGDIAPVSDQAPAEVHIPQAAEVQPPVQDPPQQQPSDPVKPEQPGEETPKEVAGLLTALMDTREKARAHAAELDAARRELAKYQQQSPPLSIYDDPEGYQAQMEQRLAAQERDMRFGMSERFAAQAHGAETVEAAKEWALQRPQGWRVDALQQADPIGWIVAEYRKDQTLGQIGDKSFEDAAKAWAEANGYAAQQQPAGHVPAPAPKQPSAPRSLASAPSAGGSAQSIPTHSLAALEALPLKG